MAEAQAAIRAAFTGSDVVAVLGALRDQALKGDSTAASAFLTRVCGKSREEPNDAAIELPPLDSAENIATAMARLASAAASGELETADATALAGLVERVADATTLRELAERVAALEGRR